MIEETQVWEKRLEGTDIAERRMHLDVDHEARVWIHERLLAQLLVAAGWERVG